jgi:hypothetical protein
MGSLKASHSEQVLGHPLLSGAGELGDQLTQRWQETDSLLPEYADDCSGNASWVLVGRWCSWWLSLGGWGWLEVESRIHLAQRRQ